ncbi:MAG TPA: hypothetical protein VFP84_27690 [Kofleriaceae bacterium]|nr:hypothetical protein [Kofleriaceae bacterium]
MPSNISWSAAGGRARDTRALHVALPTHQPVDASARASSSMHAIISSGDTSRPPYARGTDM